jgi:multiple sugar transport system substrate-binding protein
MMGNVTRRTLLRANAVAGGLLPLAMACGGSASQGNSNASVPALSKEKVSLRLNARSGGDEALWSFLAPKFAEKFPNVGVTVEAFPGDFTSYLQKVTVLAASGQLGDVLYNTTSSGLFDVLVASKLLRPVDDLVRADKFDVKVFYRPGIDLLTREGKLYGLPNTCQPGSVVIFYNKQMLQSGGAALPTPDSTPDDVVTAAKRVTRPGGDVWGYVPDLAATGILAEIQAFGGRWLSKDGKKADLNQPGTRQALQYVSDLINRHSVTPPPSVNLQGGAQGAFIAGKVAMFVGSTSNATALTDQTDVEVGTTLLPQVKKGLPRGIMRVDAWSVSSASKFPRETWEVCKFIAGPEGAVARLDVPGGSGTLGCTPSAWSNPDVMKKRGLMQQMFVKALDESEVNILAANYRNDEYQQVMMQKLAPVWRGEAQVNDSLMQDLQQSVQVVLDKPNAA